MVAFDIDRSLDMASERPETRRAAILHHAERLFAERGYQRTTVREIADAADVNVATLHLHWKSKATLYEAVCRAQARYVVGAWQRAGESGVEQDPRERLQGWLERAVDLLAVRPTLAPLALQGLAEREAASLPDLLRHDLSVFQLFERELRKAVPGAGGRDSMLAALCIFDFLVLCFVDSPLQQNLLGGSIYEDAGVRARVKRFTRHLLAGLVGARDA